MDIVRLKYGYDRSGNRLHRRDEVARSNSASFDELYGYDGLNRLTSFDRGELNGGNTGLTGSPTFTQDWTLDSTGNWSGFSQTVQSPLTQTRVHSTVNEITGIGETVGTAWPNPAYDSNGNTTSFPKPASLGDGMTASYDAWNRLVKVADSGGTVAEYQYDGLNRRTEKVVAGTTRHYYFSDQWQVLEERTGSSTTADRQYVWGQRYVDGLVLRDRTSERLYALQDALFNVVALASNAGAVQERFAYQPYGQSESLDHDFSPYSGTDFNWEYRFTGREFDLESGLQINRHRYLHLQLGRWLSRDPMRYVDGSNLYENVTSNPINLEDPSGQLSVVGVGNNVSRAQCGRDMYAQWDFFPQFPVGGGRYRNGAPCTGYLVQHVTVTCSVNKCPLGQPVFDSFEYWEAWPIERGEVRSPRAKSGAGRHTDRANFPISNDTWGAYLQFGEVRFYCKDDIGDLESPLSEWNDGQVNQVTYPLDRLSDCQTGPGILLSTGKKPAFWDMAPKDGPANRFFGLGWYCCCPKASDNYAYGYASPIGR